MVNNKICKKFNRCLSSASFVYGGPKWFIIRLRKIRRLIKVKIPFQFSQYNLSNPRMGKQIKSAIHIIFRKISNFLYFSKVSESLYIFQSSFQSSLFESREAFCDITGHWEKRKKRQTDREQTDLWTWQIRKTASIFNVNKEILSVNFNLLTLYLKNEDLNKAP